MLSPPRKLTILQFAKAVVAKANPDSPVFAGRNAHRMTARPAQIGRYGNPTPVNFPRELPVLRRRPKFALCVFADRLHRFEGEAAFHAMKFDAALAQTIESAAAGAHPNVSFAILGQRENLAMRGVDQFAT